MDDEYLILEAFCGCSCGELMVSGALTAQVQKAKQLMEIFENPRGSIIKPEMEVAGLL
jgi:hypothetical protein